MSALAVNLYDRLRNSGMAEKVRAQSVSVDEYHRRMEETPTRAESDTQFERVGAQFDRVWREIERVWKALDELRREMHEGFAAQRREMNDLRNEIRESRRDTNRLLYGILLAIFLVLLKDIVGL